MLTHYNLVANLVTLNAIEGETFSSNDVINGVLPFFHVHVPSVQLTILLTMIEQIYGMQILMNFTLWYDKLYGETHCTNHL